jgi:hypothetical protein
MIRMAGRARRCEFLRRLMNGPVMAGEAFLIGNFLVEKSGLGCVARCALPRQHCMRSRQRPRRIDASIAAHAVPGKPHKRKRRQRCGQYKSPVPQRARPLKIFQVDALREFFSCACSRHVSLFLVLIRNALCDA